MVNGHIVQPHSDDKAISNKKTSPAITDITSWLQVRGSVIVLSIYDWEFWDWAAAKVVRLWGELNLSVYGRSLSHLAVPQDSPTAEVPVCYKWIQQNCQCPNCKYLHVCLESRGLHKRGQCH